MFSGHSVPTPVFLKKSDRLLGLYPTLCRPAKSLTLLFLHYTSLEPHNSSDALFLIGSDRLTAAFSTAPKTPICACAYGSQASAPSSVFTMSSSPTTGAGHHAGFSRHCGGSICYLSSVSTTPTGGCSDVCHSSARARRFRFLRSVIHAAAIDIIGLIRLNTQKGR